VRKTIGRQRPKNKNNDKIEKERKEKKKTTIHVQYIGATK
jgi:hypothetical protein